jgi:hypothetical protein
MVDGIDLYSEHQSYQVMSELGLIAGRGTPVAPSAPRRRKLTPTEDTDGIEVRRTQRTRSGATHHP